MKMQGHEVDAFSAKLAHELAVLDDLERENLFMSIAERERSMRMRGQERPVWRGPAPVKDILGSEVVIPTEHGERRGRVICFGVVEGDDAADDCEKSVVVYVPSSGTYHEGPGSLARLANQSDLERSSMELRMSDRLRLAQSKPVPPPKMQSPKKKGLRDDALVKRLVESAKISPSVVSLEEKKGSHKIVGRSGRKLYILKGVVRVDLSGFTMEHRAIRQLSIEDAKDMHLGSVRAQITFDDIDASLEAFELCLTVVG